MRREQGGAGHLRKVLILKNFFLKECDQYICTAIRKMHMKNSTCLKQRQRGLNSSDIGLNSFDKVISSKTYFMFSLQLGKRYSKSMSILASLSEKYLH